MTPDVFTTDYTGTPGERTFFIQVREGSTTSSYLVEKAQIAALAERLRELLVMTDEEDAIRSAVPARDPALSLEEPEAPSWRVGTIGLGYEEGTDQFVIALDEILEEGEDPDVTEHASATYLLRRDQVRALVLHAMAIVGEGRQICQLCGLPMDPAGHQCPASNGHHSRA